MTAHTRPGFSLVELVMTMTIIAISASIALPRYSRAHERYCVDRAADRIVRDLAFAATRARVRGEEVRIYFLDGDKPHESRYWFADLTDPQRPDSLYTVVLRDEPYRVLVDDAPGDIRFGIDGKPTDSKTIVLERGAVIRSVFVDKNTGEVTVQ